ncbi:hypothetical protein F4778DRAFT_724077 [Xylariomycetidae sp. FL2044]|nr:hypothetical protein F4778DRAFT_724077 [Xylariomycetidae sp. FL2044]
MSDKKRKRVDSPHTTNFLLGINNTISNPEVMQDNQMPSAPFAAASYLSNRGIGEGSAVHHDSQIEWNPYTHPSYFADPGNSREDALPATNAANTFGSEIQQYTLPKNPSIAMRPISANESYLPAGNQLYGPQATSSNLGGLTGPPTPIVAAAASHHQPAGDNEDFFGYYEGSWPTQGSTNSTVAESDHGKRKKLRITRACDQCHEYHEVCSGGIPCSTCTSKNRACTNERQTAKRGSVPSKVETLEAALGVLVEENPDFEDQIIQKLRNSKLSEGAAARKKLRGIFSASRLASYLQIGRNNQD